MDGRFDSCILADEGRDNRGRPAINFTAGMANGAGYFGVWVILPRPTLSKRPSKNTEPCVLTPSPSQ